MPERGRPDCQVVPDALLIAGNEPDPLYLLQALPLARDHDRDSKSPNGCGSKPMVPFWGMFTGGTIWTFDPWPNPQAVGRLSFRVRQKRAGCRCRWRLRALGRVHARPLPADVCRRYLLILGGSGPVQLPDVQIPCVFFSSGAPKCGSPLGQSFESHQKTRHPCGPNGLPATSHPRHPLRRGEPCPSACLMPHEVPGPFEVSGVAFFCIKQKKSSFWAKDNVGLLVGFYRAFCWVFWRQRRLTLSSSWFKADTEAILVRLPRHDARLRAALRQAAVVLTSVGKREGGCLTTCWCDR